MNKTVSINLSGLVFQIDDIAYDKLLGYLNAIKSRFAGAEGADEIMDDIEARIAEMLTDRLSSRKEVISMQDVEHVIGVMGKPEDFGDIEDEEEPRKQSATGRGVGASRRLFRDPDNKVFAGVCSGISAYLGVNDPIWIRLLFIIMMFGSFGSGFIIYIILMLIIPEANSTTEKLQMRGEPINIDNIEKTIKEELHNLKDSFSHKKKANHAHHTFARLIGLFVTLIVSAAALAARFFAVIFIMVGTVGLIALIATPLIGLSISNFPPLDFLNLFFENAWQTWLGIIGLLLMVFMPFIAILFFGIRLLLGGKRHNKGYGIGAFSFVFVGFVCVTAVAVSMMPQFSEKEEIKELVYIEQPINKVIYLEQSNFTPNYSNIYDINDLGETYWSEDSLWLSSRIKLDIVKSKTDIYSLEKYAKASGRNRELAYKRAAALSCNVEQTDSLLTIPRFLFIDKDKKLRDQEIQLILAVPEGQSVYIGSSMRNIIHDIENVSNTWDGNMVGHIWTMKPEGLSCMDCDFDEGNFSKQDGSKSKYTYELSDFDEIEIEGAFNTTIKYSQNYDVKIFGGNKFLKEVDVKKTDNKLVIDGSQIWGTLWHEVRLEISLPNPEHITLTGANQFEIKGFENTGQIKIDLDGASKGSIEVDCQKLNLAIAGASKVNIRGRTDVLNIESDGASRIVAYSMQTKTSTINLTGASSAEINVSEQLNATLDGASKLVYKGLPEIKSDVSGFSSIKPYR